MKIIFIKCFLFMGIVVVTAQVTAIPDVNFETYLEQNGMGDGSINGLVPTAKISSVTILDVNNQSSVGKPIKNLTGIEDFVALNTLRFVNNGLETLDVSQNLELSTLICSNNQLTSLDVSKNTKLRDLTFHDNQISIIDVSSLLSLQRLICRNNQLTSLDVSKNTSLINLDARNNSLQQLNMRNGNNHNLSMPFLTMGNLSLTCIQVDLKAYMDNNWASAKDTFVNYNQDCGYVLSSDFITPEKVEFTATEGKVSVNLPNASVTVYNLSGQEADNQNLSSGVYVVKATDKKLVIVKKLLVK